MLGPLAESYAEEFGPEPLPPRPAPRGEGEGIMPLFHLGPSPGGQTIGDILDRTIASSDAANPIRTSESGQLHLLDGVEGLVAPSDMVETYL